MKKRKTEAAMRKVKDGSEDAPVATRHFANLVMKKSTKRDAARSQVKHKEPDPTLLVDYFNKLTEVNLAVKANAHSELASREMPIDITQTRPTRLQNSKGRVS